MERLLLSCLTEAAGLAATVCTVALSFCIEVDELEDALSESVLLLQAGKLNRTRRAIKMCKKEFFKSFFLFIIKKCYSNK